MVQGGLLTAHPGSVHGDGEAPGGESSLWQGVETTSPGSPDLETAGRRNREGIGKRVLLSRVSDQGEYIGEGASQGGHQGSRRPLAWPIPKARHQGTWGPGGSPPAPT